MSRAGTKSNQGDDYQRIVALHWIVRLITDEDRISYIQAESNGLPDIDEKISVDDVVVVYTDGHRRHIQVKKNQPQNRAWSLSDQNLADELPKIRDQLESKDDSIVELSSRTPFGDFQSLAEASREYPDQNAFRRESGENLKTTLTSITQKWERSDADSLKLLRRLEFASPLSFADWDRQNKQELSMLVSNADLAMPVLESFLNAHQSKLQANTLTIRREDVIWHLEQKGIVKAPRYGEAEILEQFQEASRIGRDWQRTIGGRRIERAELTELIQLIEDGADTILVTDRPGSGKTCLLLDLADCIEKDPRFSLLFIKGDRFAKLKTEGDLKGAGLPEDIVGFCGRLSELRRIVVIIDSLDVLSMNRDHGALGIFLRLLDRLNPMRNVTVVAACRSFDLQYDPLLRDREWKHRVPVADFDYETVVAPLLKKWGVQEAELDMEMLRLLLLPQNLRLFEAIVNRGGRCNIHTAYELLEVYLQEVVVKDPALGTPAITALQTLADRLLHERMQLIHPTAFSIDEPLRRALVSSGVLYEDQNDCLGFSHQTLFDNLSVYSALSRREDLVGFIKSHPPLPFLRPAVRSFVFHLRSHDPNLFSRQVWAALHDEGIAYHLRRLIAESLAEIDPHDDDWPLFRRLFRQEPELFRRLFWRIEGDAWWLLLLDHWLPSLGPPSCDSEWYSLFVLRLDRWMSTHPVEVVALWRRAFAEGWCEVNRLAGQITVHLRNFQHWQSEGIPELLEILSSEEKGGGSLLGKSISSYVDATDEGDELLWKYITKDIDLEQPRVDIGRKLCCDPHVFHDKEFLKGRLVRSEWLLDLAINALAEWVASDTIRSTKHRLTSTFLYSSSWEFRHSHRDMHPADDLTVLLTGIEQAVKHHAQANDQWWQKNEPWLRYSTEETLLYFLAKAYRENPEANVDGITHLLADAELLRYGHIEYELGELIQAGYYLLTPEMQEINQQAILGLYSDENWGGEDVPQWVHQIKYNYFIWMPVIFRFPMSQDFVERFQSKFGTALPSPHISSWGGIVGFPVPLEALMKLKDADLLRLLSYYNAYDARSSHPADYLKGGRSMIERVLGEAAAIDPMRYFALLPALDQQELQTGYALNILDGVSNHLRYRFGNLQPPQGWQAAEPAPEGTNLGRTLLNLIENRPELWKDGYSVARMLEACCEVLIDHDSAERLVFLLFRLLQHPDPQEERQRIFSQDKKGITSQDLMDYALNSVRGIGAGNAIMLYNRLLENEIEPPELLLPLLRHFARDPVTGVRAAVLVEHLPYLTSMQHALGWQLFHDIFREPQTHLWPVAERQFYYQYHEHFDEVAPYLERLRLEAPDEEGAKTWGRIATLAVLSGHIEASDLFLQLEAMNLPAAWLGAAEVFAANLDQHRHDNLCTNGLRRILQSPNLDNQIYRNIERAFEPKNHGRLLGKDIAINFIDSIEHDNQRVGLFTFLDWIADLAGRDPIAALEICERLAEKLGEMASPYQIWHHEPLIAALSSILREADETDDSQLINRAVRLQDQFLRMDISGMDDYLRFASQL